MIRFIVLALKQVFKDKKMLVTICIQVILSSLLVTFTIAFATQNLDMQLLFNDAKLSQFSLYCPRTDYYINETNNESTFTDKEEELNKLSSEAEWGILGKAFLTEFRNDNSLSECYFFNNVIADNINLHLQDGVWFGETRDSIAAAVISTDLSKQLKIGNIYNVIITDSLKTQKITVNIIGVLSEDNKMLSLSGNKASNLFCTGFSGMAIYLSDMSNIKLNMVFNNFLVKGYAESNDLQTITPVSTLIEKYTEENKLLIGVALIFAIMSVALSFSGIGVSVALKSKSDVKKCVLFYFCGAEWKTCIIIELTKMIITFLFAIVPILILYFVISCIAPNYCTVEMLMTGISISLLIYLPSSFWKTRQIIKESPIDVIKNF